jgi:hypothetical protein
MTNQAMDPFAARYSKQLQDNSTCQQNWDEHNGRHPTLHLPDRITGTTCDRACDHGQRQHHDKLEEKAQRLSGDYNIVPETY